jgi:hypothetical protein
MKFFVIVSIIGLIIAEALVSWLIFIHWRPVTKNFADIKAFEIIDEIFPPPIKSHSGQWFLFASNSDLFAFEERTIDPKAKYSVSKMYFPFETKKNLPLQSNQSGVCFCHRDSRLEYLVGRIAILIFTFIFWGYFCGYMHKKLFSQRDGQQ